NEEIARWNADDVFPLHARKHEVRVGVLGQPPGARLAVRGYEASRNLHAMLPALDRQHRTERGRQFRALGLATAALVSVVFAYIYGVPLIARNIVAMV